MRTGHIAKVVFFMPAFSNLLPENPKTGKTVPIPYYGSKEVPKGLEKILLKKLEA